MAINTLCNALVKIKNANLLGSKFVKIPATSFILQILEILKLEKFILNYYLLSNNKEIFVNLRYEKNYPLIQIIELLSKPGLHKYVNLKKIKKTNNNYGQTLISTPSGLLTNKQADIKKIGGEFLFKIN